MKQVLQGLSSLIAVVGDNHGEHLTERVVTNAGRSLVEDMSSILRTTRKTKEGKKTTIGT
jgi:hypothetical protein